MTKATTPRTAAPVIVTDFHKAIAAAVNKFDKSIVSFRDGVSAAIQKRYGATMPTKAEYDNDQQALAQLAKANKLADNQHYRKVFAKAINDIFGALPVELGQEAAKKRTQRINAAPKEQQAAYHAAKVQHKDAPEHVREALAMSAFADAKPKPKQDSAGAPAGEVKDQITSAAESLEQAIARFGLPSVLEACAKILDAERATRTQAKTLAAIAGQIKTA